MASFPNGVNLSWVGRNDTRSENSKRTERRLPENPKKLTPTFNNFYSFSVSKLPKPALTSKRGRGAKLRQKKKRPAKTRRPYYKKVITSLLVLKQKFRDQTIQVFQESFVQIGKSVQNLRVNINLTNVLAVHEKRHDNLRFHGK